jgi:hypothetical protein
MGEVFHARAETRTHAGRILVYTALDRQDESGIGVEGAVRVPEAARVTSIALDSNCCGGKGRG